MDLRHFFAASDFFISVSALSRTETSSGSVIARMAALSLAIGTFPGAESREIRDWRRYHVRYPETVHLLTDSRGKSFMSFSNVASFGSKSMSRMGAGALCFFAYWSFDTFNLLSSGPGLVILD